MTTTITPGDESLQTAHDWAFGQGSEAADAGRDREPDSLFVYAASNDPALLDAFAAGWDTSIDLEMVHDRIWSGPVDVRPRRAVAGTDGDVPGHTPRWGGYLL